MARRKFNYGGQAVIEGVMIRGRTAAAVVVRRPNGHTVTDCQPLPNLYTGRARQFVFIRGIIVLIETMVLGMRALMFSANAALEEEDAAAADTPKASAGLAWLALPLAFVVAIGFFFVAPLLLARQVDISSPVVSNLVEGAIRLALFVGYLSAISLMPDMRRVFMYHGAEHMTIAAHEHGAPLELKEIERYPKEHPRCGTAFLLTVVVVAVVVFALVGMARPPLWGIVLSRVALIPVIAAVSYEVIRFNAAHETTWFGRLGMMPGLWLQWLTTRHPTEDQIEVAVAAMTAALVADGELAPVTPRVNGSYQMVREQDKPEQ